MTERHHFLIDPKCIKDDRFVLNGSEGHHLKNVVRLGVGDEIYLLDQKGNAFRSIIDKVAAVEITGHVEETITDYNSPAVRLHLAIGLLKGNKMVEVAKRATELGVFSITPLLMKHSVKRNNNRERLLRVMASAQKQCGRGLIPELRTSMRLVDWCQKSPVEFKAFTHPSLDSIPLNRWLNSIKDTEEISLLVGPEGGYHKDEIAILKRQEISPVSLGNTRMRSETAAIAAAAVSLEYFHARKSNV